MSSNWEIVKLGDYCSKIGSGSTPRGGSNIYLDNGQFALIRSQNILNNSFSINGLVYIDENEANKLKNVSVEENDVLLNITGDSVARVCKAPKEYLPARVNQHVAIIRADEIHLDSSYLNYYLNSLDMQNYMLSLASTGATRNALTKNMIENFEIIKPPLPIQKKIAHILSTLDDKIELNHKMNQTLEAMASAIFKSWFVDFDPVHVKVNAAGREDALGYKANCEGEAELENIAKELGISKAILDLFPSEFIESELGMIPKGWELFKLGNITKFQQGKQIELEDQFLEPTNEMLRFVRIIDYTSENEPPRYIKADKNSSSYVTVEDVVMIRYGSQTAGKVVIGKAGIIANNMFRVIPIIDKLQREYLYYFLKSPNIYSYLRDGQSSSTMPAITFGLMASLDIILPEQEILVKFSQVIKSFIAKYFENDKQIETLQKTRDTLLPKLLSGEIDVSELEI